MATRKKLYYNFPPQVVVIPVGGSVPLAAKILTSAADDYGNVLDQNPSPGTPGDALAKTLAAIGAWFQPAATGTGISAPPVNVTGVAAFTFCVQFYDGAGVAPAFGVASIDPATVKNPAVQLFAVGVAGNYAVDGKLYVQRQHSIEV
jgi:hypothetical protein